MRSNAKTWAHMWLAAVVAASTVGFLTAGRASAVGTTRPLYIFAPALSDPRLASQKAINAAAAAGFRERDMTVTVVTGPSSLRRRFNVGPREFRIVLVGKDGGVKLSSSNPVSAQSLFGLIDAMPMRRIEMRDRGR